MAEAHKGTEHSPLHLDRCAPEENILSLLQALFQLGSMRRGQKGMAHASDGSQEAGELNGSHVSAPLLWL